MGRQDGNHCHGSLVPVSLSEFKFQYNIGVLLNCLFLSVIALVIPSLLSAFIVMMCLCLKK